MNSPLQPLPFCVYILYSLKDHKNYIGFTTRLPIRLKEHNAGESKATKDRRPLVLIYCEFHHHREDALRRERYFKTNPGKRTLKQMIRKFLENKENYLPEGKTK
jgi:putative endonuclease